MAIPKVSWVTFFLLSLVVAAVPVSCYASRDAPDAGEKAAAVIVEPLADPKCEVVETCSVQACTEYCVRIGLGQEKGFCTFRDLQFYCCCPVLEDPPRN